MMMMMMMMKMMMMMMNRNKWKHLPRESIDHRLRLRPTNDRRESNTWHWLYDRTQSLCPRTIHFPNHFNHF